MLRMSRLWLAVLSFAACVALVPAKSSAGDYSGLWYGGWSSVPHWAYYDGRFVPSGPFGYRREYAAFNPSCTFVRRVVPTPVGPQWQLVPVCF